MTKPAVDKKGETFVRKRFGQGVKQKQFADKTRERLISDTEPLDPDIDEWFAFAERKLWLVVKSCAQ